MSFVHHIDRLFELKLSVCHWSPKFFFFIKLFLSLSCFPSKKRHLVKILIVLEHVLYYTSLLDTGVYFNEVVLLGDLPLRPSLAAPFKGLLFCSQRRFFIVTANTFLKILLLDFVYKYIIFNKLFLVHSESV